MYEFLTTVTEGVVHGSVGTIRGMVDYSSVTVYKDGRSFSFSNNQIFSLNLIYNNVSQYPRIFKIY